MNQEQNVPSAVELKEELLDAVTGGVTLTEAYCAETENQEYVCPMCGGFMFLDEPGCPDLICEKCHIRYSSSKNTLFYK